MTKEPLRPAPARSTTAVRGMHGDGLGDRLGVIEGEAVLDGDRPVDTDAVAEAVMDFDDVAEGVTEAVGEGGVYTHHRPDDHAAVLNCDTATKYCVWLVTAIVTCARNEHPYGTEPPSSFDATQPHASGVPPEGHRRNTYSVLSPVALIVPGYAGFAHDDTSSEPPTG